MILDSTAVLTVAIPSVVTALGLVLNYFIQKSDRDKGRDAAEFKRLQEAELVRHALDAAQQKVSEKVENVSADQNKVLGEIHEKVNGNLDKLRAENQRLQGELLRTKTKSKTERRQRPR